MTGTQRQQRPQLPYRDVYSPPLHPDVMARYIEKAAAWDAIWGPEVAEKAAAAARMREADSIERHRVVGFAVFMLAGVGLITKALTWGWVQ